MSSPTSRPSTNAECGAADGVLPGRIDLDAACRSLPQAARAVYYLCGPQAMIDAFAARLKGEFGVAEANIKIDQWQ